MDVSCGLDASHLWMCIYLLPDPNVSSQTVDIYAPVLVMGSGMSIMYVMALTLATELTGKDKVHVSCYYTNSNHTLLEDDRNLRAKTTSSLSVRRAKRARQENGTRVLEGARRERRAHVNSLY